jgi:kexin
MALWGSAIDSSKVTKFVEPIVDNALPPVADQDRPNPDEVPDETETTQHAKPTDYLPIGHGHDPGEKTKPAFSGPQEAADKGWISTLSGLLHSHKIFLAGIGGMVFLGFGMLYYLWKRRADRQRQRVAYTPLTTDEIQMDAVGRHHDGPLNDHDAPDDLPPREASVQPPTGRALGFHSGFLDDDEPSAGLTPKYRDEPDEEDHSDDSVMMRRTSDEEFATPMDSREGSRERLTS